MDGCYEDVKDMARDYPAFGAALNKTGRPMVAFSGLGSRESFEVYSCSWPAYMPKHCEKSDGCMNSLVEHCATARKAFKRPLEAPRVEKKRGNRGRGNLWRNFDDVMDSWDSDARQLVKCLTPSKTNVENGNIQGSQWIYIIPNDL